MCWGRDPVKPLPIRDNESLKLELGLEEIGDEEVVGVHLDAIPAGEGHHHRGHPLRHGAVVGRHVHRHQLPERRHRVVLVHAARRAAVADVVLRARRHARPPAGDEGDAAAAAGRDLALEAGDDGGHALHHPGVLAEALVAAAPPRVPAHRHAWREHVRDPRRPHLRRHRRADPLRQIRVPGAAEADVVGEDGGLVDVAVAMDGVDAVDHGDPEARRHGAALHLVHHRHPRRRRRLRRRHAAAAAQHAPCNLRDIYSWRSRARSATSGRSSPPASSAGVGRRSSCSAAASSPCT
ncbi:Os02g0131500, partial [Oryza sativa Japonica Group]